MRLTSVLVALVAASATARALPPAGTAVDAVVVDDVDRRPRTLPDRRLPLLVFYEDRQAGNANHRIHLQLSRMAERPENRGRIEVVPIGDVESFDFWPARSIVVSVIRDRMRRDHTTIWCDWKGRLRRAWGLARGKSGLVLLDGDGRVRFAAEGPLEDARIKELMQHLATLGVDTGLLDARAGR